MPKVQPHFWIVRSPISGVEVPVLQDDVAETFRRAGWEVNRLPLATLEERNLRCLKGGRGSRGARGGR